MSDSLIYWENNVSRAQRERIEQLMPAIQVETQAEDDRDSRIEQAKRACAERRARRERQQQTTT